LRQILLNIAGNAIKFCQEGHVQIVGEVLHNTDKELGFKINIQDTGCGIPKDRIHLLFKSFSQVDPSTTRTFGGTGLGLYLAKQFAELLGGKITVESDVGVGSTFSVFLTLPKASAVTPELSQPQQQQQAELHKDAFAGVQKHVKILVVDDNVINQQVALKLLSYFGFLNCDTANDGEKALAAMKTHQYDIVLMDCMMPLKVLDHNAYEALLITARRTATKRRESFEPGNEKIEQCRQPSLG
jgi:CheY-like chemotaxis protein